MNQISLRGGKAMEYSEVLTRTQSDISANHSAEVSGLIGNQDKENRMKAIVKRSLINLNINLSSNEHVDETVSMLYEDMAGMSFLSKYLKHLDKYPGLEEININAWNSVVMKYSGGRTEFTDESFLSPKHAMDIIKSIVSQHGDVLDDAIPEVTSYISENIRITAKKYPLIPKEFGVVASIRITRPSAITGETLIKGGTVSNEIMSFLLTCIKYSVSLLIGGKQYSGKTTLLNYLLSQVENDKRIYLIEEGSRELSLVKYDENGRMLNQIIPCLTRPSENKEQNFDAQRELKFGLRYNTDIFVPQELRGAEAYTAVDSGNTGSAVMSSIHANYAENAYPRITSLMQQGSNQDEDTLMRLAVEAFPLVVYMAKLKDGTRRVMEVLEGEKYVRGEGLVCRTIFRYCVDDNIEKKNGTVKVIGHFERVEGISKRLQRILLNNGAPKKIVDSYMDLAKEA